MRHYLWRRKTEDVQCRGASLVAWQKVCKPKNQGGLGVLDLEIQNKCLLLKNVHKLFNREDMPWVNLILNTYYANGVVPGQHFEGSFWWKSNLKLVDIYKGMAKYCLGDGKSVMFW